MSDYPPITEGLRSMMLPALDGDTEEELLYCPTSCFNDECDSIDAVHATLERQCERQRVHDGGLVVHPFIRDDDKTAALKPLEEAAEIYGAWQSVDALLEYHRLLEQEHPETAAMFSLEAETAELADEIADTITACVNLAHRYGIDLQAAIDRVEVHNRERGRYDG